MAPLYEQKERLWTLAGLNSTSTIPLTLADPLPKKVLQYLRIQRLEEADISAMTLQLVSGTNERVNDGNERQILEFLIESISSLLNDFAISLQDLESKLTDGFYNEGSNAWAAAHVSLGEQRVLRMAERRARDLLAAIDDGPDSSPTLTKCANCGNDSSLMLCSRCKAVKYCGRTCQVTHFKEHKALCRTIATENSAKA